MSLTKKLATWIFILAGIINSANLNAPTTKNLENRIAEKIASSVYKEQNKDIAINIPKYEGFKYPDELSLIFKHAEILEVEPELLMAIRMAEDGDPEIEYGVLPQGKMLEEYKKEKGYLREGEFYSYKDRKEKQLNWATRTVKYYQDKFKENPKNHKDFISYLADKYAPIGARNDPRKLNNHWEDNVRNLYHEFKKISREIKTYQSACQLYSYFSDVPLKRNLFSQSEFLLTQK